MTAVQLALESVLLRGVHGAVLRGLALRHLHEDAALLQLTAELAAGRHEIMLRTTSMEFQAQVGQPHQVHLIVTLQTVWGRECVQHTYQCLKRQYLSFQISTDCWSCEHLEVCCQTCAPPHA